MKEYEVKITRQAFEQIETIVHYISNVLMAPDAANHLLDEMRSEIAKLSAFRKDMP